MAIAEDASTPTTVTATASTAPATTTASFTPPVGSVLVALVSYDWSGNYTGSPASPTFSDNRSGTWTLVASANAGSGGAAQTAVAYQVITVSQSMTVTCTAIDSKSKTKFLSVRVLTGAAITGTIAGSLFSGNTTGTNGSQKTVTTTTTGSYVCGCIAKDANQTLTANGNTTNFTTSPLKDSGVGAVVAQGKATSLTGTPGSLSFGWTGSSGASACVGNIVEIMPGASGPVPIDDSDTVSLDDEQSVDRSGILLTNDLESGSNGTTLTTGNTASPSAFDVINTGTGTTCAFDSAHAAHGSLGLKIQNGTGAAGVQWTTSAGSNDTIFGRFYLFTPALPTSNTRIFQGATSSLLCAAIYLNTTGTLTFVNSGAGTIFTSTGTSVNVGGWTRIEFMIKADPSVGQVQLKIFNTMDSVTADYDNTSSATQNTTGLMSVYALGMAFDAHANFGPFYFDDIGISSDAFLGPAAVTPTPITGTDTSSLSDVGSVVANTNSNDTGNQAEVSSVHAAVPSSDTGTQVEATTILAALPDSDAATLSESGRIALPSSDAASLSEGAGVQAAIPSSETSAQGETGIVAAHPPGADISSAGESSSIAATQVGTDTSAMAESVSIVVTISSADSGSSSDTESLDQGATAKSSSDSSSMAETYSIVVSLSSSDTGTLLESSGTHATLSNSDSGTLIEAQSIRGAVTSRDTSILTERGKKVQTGGFPFPDQDFTTTIKVGNFSGGISVHQVSASSVLQVCSAQDQPDQTEYSSDVLNTSIDAVAKAIALSGEDHQTELAGTASNIGR